MPKKTTLEQFNEISADRDQQAVRLVNERLGQVPDVLWLIGGAGGGFDPEKWVVTQVTAARVIYFKKRPTREQIRDLMDVGPVSEDEAFISITKEGAQTCQMMAVTLSKLCQSENHFLKQEDAEARSRFLKDVYIPKFGQFACRYCGKATDNDKKYVGTVFARQYPGGRQKFDYCSTRCASYDQMAHEG